ncbi:hypothetical protein CBR_g48193 [Chara braunii]|uniref:Cyclic nucleotide-binding domain-containing protein n=1 Tax=Chara braunii TaxID=69332 RepID=A0A388M2H3_CHABU|nr:hypothetical protein CBR_g48193 [Chara braunii]|eukprot:GBG88663.1 hypothetical protein CBR_g48193 [Chara braunii]
MSSSKTTSSKKDDRGKGKEEADGYDTDYGDEESPSSTPRPLREPSKLGMKRRTGVSAEVLGVHDIKELKVIPKTKDAKMRISQALKKNYLFKSLDPEQEQKVVDAVFEKKFQAGQNIINYGEGGDNFYLLEDGNCEVYVPVNGQPTLVTKYGPGDAFGELALLYNAPRAATVKAVTDVLTWAMDRNTFKVILMQTTRAKRDMYEKFLEDVPLLKSLDKYERSAIADVLEAEYFDPGKVIIREGEVGNKMYFLEEGEAEARTGGTFSVKYKRGDYFGELALLNDAPRKATVTALTKVKVVSIDRKSFKRLFGKLEDIMKRKKDDYRRRSNR